MSTESLIDGIKVTISEAARVVNKMCRAGLVPMIHGSPALGKSAVAKMIAKKNNLKLIDLRLSQCEPTDLLGLPAINALLQRSGYLPMETFPLAGDALPLNEEGVPYNGWLLFLDEFNSAERQTQAAAYKVVLDRMIGMFDMHDKVFPLCAGNLETDGAIVEPMSTAMQSRLCHIEVRPDAKEWCEWAISVGIDNRLVSFIEYMPGHVYSFKPDHNDRTYSSPRTLEFADKWLKNFPITDEDSRTALSGILGHGVASELLTYCRIYGSLPKMSEILVDPINTPIPDETERGQLFATFGAIAHAATPENVETLIKYCRRMPKDFQIVGQKMMMSRNRSLMNVPAVTMWFSDFAQYLFKN